MKLIKTNIYCTVILAVVYMSYVACDHKHDKKEQPVVQAPHDHLDHLDDHGHDHGHEHEHEHPSEDLEEIEHDHLEAKILKQIGVKMTQFHPQDYAPTIKIPGEIKIDPDRRVTISAPVAARIISLDAPPHAIVKAGKRLALLELADTDVRHQQIKAVEFRAELIAAQTEHDRTSAYLEAIKDGQTTMASELRRVEADLEVQKAKVRSRQSALQAVIASLKLAGLSNYQLAELEKNGKVTTRISLYAPTLANKPDLEIIQRPVQAGQTVSPGAMMFELAALDRLRVVGEAFEADLPAVRRAVQDHYKVSLLFPATRKEVFDLEIFSIEGALDGSARIIHFFMWLPNKVLGHKKNEGHLYHDWEYRAGERVQIRVPTQKKEPKFILPIEAVIRRGGRHWVFFEHHDGCDRRAVQVEAIEGGRAIIPLDGGIKSGERIVVYGALQLQLALQESAEAASGGAGRHGHQH
jgi:hypothetical protein